MLKKQMVAISTVGIVQPPPFVDMIQLILVNPFWLPVLSMLILMENFRDCNTSTPLVNNHCRCSWKTGLLQASDNQTNSLPLFIITTIQLFCQPYSTLSVTIYNTTNMGTPCDRQINWPRSEAIIIVIYGTFNSLYTRPACVFVRVHACVSLNYAETGILFFKFSLVMNTKI